MGCCSGKDEGSTCSVHLQAELQSCKVGASLPTTPLGYDLGKGARQGHLPSLVCSHRYGTQNVTHLPQGVLGSS